LLELYGWRWKVGLEERGEGGGGDCLRREEGCLGVEGMWVWKGIIDILNIK
jgi:hypothetical protein